MTVLLKYVFITECFPVSENNIYSKIWFSIIISIRQLRMRNMSDLAEHANHPRNIVSKTILGDSEIWW